jgi:inner membrane transporter RhtA
MLPIFFLLIAFFSIQFGATVAKQLFVSLGAAQTASLRLLVAAAVLCAFFRPWQQSLTVREGRVLAIYGAVLSGMNVLFYMALERVPLGVTVTIEFLGPLTVALLTSRKLLDIVWAVLAAIGISCISLPQEYVQPLDRTGFCLALGAGALWGLYILFSKKAGSSLKGGTAVSWGMAMGAVLTLPLSLSSARVFWESPSLILPVVGVALFSSAVPYTIEMQVLKQMPVYLFGILMSLEPAIAALSGSVFLGEQLTALQWVGVGSVAAASVGSSFFSLYRR